MTNQIQATETQTQEVMSLLPEEISDLLSEKALEELQQANLVPFTPVQDAEKLDQIIAATQKKLVTLLSLDVSQALKQDLEGFAQIEGENGETRNVALINQVNPPLDAIISIEAKVSAAISKYQKILVDCLKQKRLLSGQMYGTRLAHSAQVSRMKRVRQISVTGNDLLKEFSGAAVNPKIEMEPAQKAVELFPKEEAIEVSFEPLPDTLPFAQASSQISPEHTQSPQEQKREKQSTKKDKQEELYCDSFHD